MTGLSLKINNAIQIDKLYTIFMTEYDSDYKFHGESHNFWELLCILDGAASVTAGSKVFTLTKGEAILHSPMQFHNLSSIGTKPLTIAVFTFSGKNIPLICDRVCRISDISLVKTLCKSALKIFEFESCWVKNILSDENSLHLFIKQLETLILTLSENITKSVMEKSQSAKNYSIIIKTLQDNINRRLNVHEIAKLCNMSEINLQKTFSKYAGVGIIEYFTGIKMHYATSLLKNGNSVKETALALGYDDQNYFSTVYKRITGHTPTYIQRKKQKTV